MVPALWKQAEGPFFSEYTLQLQAQWYNLQTTLPYILRDQNYFLCDKKVSFEWDLASPENITA